MHGCIIPALRDLVDVVGVDVSITKRQAGDTFFFLSVFAICNRIISWLERDRPQVNNECHAQFQHCRCGLEQVHDKINAKACAVIKYISP